MAWAKIRAEIRAAPISRIGLKLTRLERLWQEGAIELTAGVRLKGRAEEAQPAQDWSVCITITWKARNEEVAYWGPDRWEETAPGTTPIESSGLGRRL